MGQDIAVGQIIVGIVKKIFKTFIIVKIADFNALCHISEVSDYLVSDLKTYFKTEEKYHFVVISIDNNGKVALSYKKIHPKDLRFHWEIIPTPSGFINLKKFVDEKTNEF